MLPELILDPLALSRTIRADYDNHALMQVNDHEVRLSVMTAPYPWHLHPDSDETFMTVDGDLIIEFEDGSVQLATKVQCSISIYDFITAQKA